MEVEALELGDCIGIIYFILNRGFVNSILRAVQRVSLADIIWCITSFDFREFFRDYFFVSLAWRVRVSSGVFVNFVGPFIFIVFRDLFHLALHRFFHHE